MRRTQVIGHSALLWAIFAALPANAQSNAQAEELPVKGLTSYYWRAGGGYQYNTLSKNDPANSNSPIADVKHKLLLGGVIGWGPIRAEDLYFNIHYSYTQDWKTDPGQFDQFTSQWFSKPTSENFLFRTQDLLRSHELATDLRYVSDPFQAGMFTRFTLGRVGSKVLGAEFEESRTVVKTENFVPYVSYKYGRYYRGQLSIPLRTEINEDQLILSNSSYSFSSTGRGFFLSYNFNNGFFVPPINSLVYADLFYQKFKYASIQNDRDQIGFAISIDFPVIWRLRAVPKVVYYRQNFVADRVRIPCFKRNSSTECAENPVLIARKDTFLGSGGTVYYDVTESQRVSGNFLANRTTSTIPEFNIVEYLFTVSYQYSWPRTSQVQKRVQRFQENKYAEEF
jgi:hypothetical protein